MSNVFDSLLEAVVKIISEKKNKRLDELDQQLVNFKCWYLSFDKQVKKTYPTEEDTSFLDPTKAELVNKLSTIIDATGLFA